MPFFQRFGKPAFQLFIGGLRIFVCILATMAATVSAQQILVPGYYISQSDLAISIHNHKKSVRHLSKRISRFSHSPLEADLLAIAESLYPRKEKVLSWVMTPRRVDRKIAVPVDSEVWWDFSFPEDPDEVRIVPLPTRAAIRYYSDFLDHQQSGARYHLTLFISVGHSCFKRNSCGISET